MLQNNIFNETIIWDSVAISLMLIFIGFFFLGLFIIYKQVALVKKGELDLRDKLQCLIYGIIFSTSVQIVFSMAFVFAIETPSFWVDSPTPAPDLQPLLLLIPFFICLAYISLYPLIDFLFIALSEKSDEGLTPFHKFIGDHFINKSKSKAGRVIIACGLYTILVLPSMLFWGVYQTLFIMVLLTSLLIYPLMILTFYGSKGYIAGISNQYYHLPDLKRSTFLAFEDGKRSIEEFKAAPAPRIMVGLMLFVYVWAWISMIQTLAFFFTGTMAVSTMSYAGMVFVTLLMGIIGYFTRFWGRKIKYRGIDIYFAAYLMAAVGINVLVNFMIVNPDKLANVFNFTFFGLHELIPNFRTFAFAAVIEEIVLIIFTTYYFVSKKNEFTGNIKYALITQTSQMFDPIPLFNFIKNDIPRVRQYAQESLILMFERIPYKKEIDINQGKFRNSLMDGICDPNSHANTTCYKILVQLEKDIPDTVLPWIIEALESPNYDKSIPVAKSLLNADINLVERIPENIIFNLIQDKEWRLKLLGLKILSRLIDKNDELILNLNLDELVNDPDSKVKIETLNILAKSSVVLPADIIIELINNSNKEIRAAGIKNIKNLDENRITPQIISKIMPLMKDTSATVRSSIFEVFAKVGHFQKFFIPILPFLDGLTDLNEEVRTASIGALEKYFDEQPGSLDIDVIISKIDPNNNAVLNSVLTLLGRLWEKAPEKILMTLLIFIKFENQELKQNISNILVDKFETNPDLIINNIINLEDVAGFVTKGIISSTLIKIAKKDPDNIIPKLISYLDSENENIRINAIVSLEGLIDDYSEKIQLKPFLTILQRDESKRIKKETSKIISKIAKTNPKAIKPVMAIILQSLNEQESSVKIVLSKSLLEIAKESPEIIPIRPIVSFLSDEESFIRETGAKILGKIGTDKVAGEVADALINKGLVDEEWIVREAAVSSLGSVIEHLGDKELIIPKLVALLDDKQAWVRRSAINIISNIEGIKASQIPFAKVESNISSSDPKVRETSAGLLKIYGYTNIDRVFDKILLLLDDEDKEVRENMIKTMVEIIQQIGLEKILSNLLKQLSDKGDMELQRSIAKIFGKTVQYEDEKIKKRVIALLKIRCEMSQDPVICETLHKLREG